ncbi:MAG: integrase core domain-containing protein [Sedimenticolaceae bacterium]
MIRFIQFILRLLTTSARSPALLRDVGAVVGLARRAVIVQPRTVVVWQKKRFREYWHALSQSNAPGRPPISPELRELFGRMWKANPTWGLPRIVAEIAKLGIEVAKLTLEKYRPCRDRSQSSTWRTFLDQHLRDLVLIAFFIVSTVTRRVLFVYVVLAHDRPRIVHVNVTEHPTAQWTVQQSVETFPFDSAPHYLIRDRDTIYGERVVRRVKGLGIEDIVTAPASPWQNAYVERRIGTLRRELLDHVIILDERHLKRLLSSYLDYYHPWRTNRPLAQDAPGGRSVGTAEASNVVELPAVHGLLHVYFPKAA